MFVEIQRPYCALLLDAYGVFWGGNGVGLLPGAKEMMQQLVSQGKVVGILSNSSQIAQKEIDKLKNYGVVQGTHYHFYLTSGQIAKDLVKNEALPFHTSQKKYWLSTPPHPKYSSPHLLFQESAFAESQNLEEADFIFASIPHIEGEDQTDPKLFESEVKKLATASLPMLCINPDRFAHEGLPARAVVRQGTIAKLYEALGGTVHYIGKPYPIAYKYAMQAFKPFGIEKAEEILMVGDTPETDIRGANGFGMASLLVTETGMMKERIFSQNSLPPSDVPTHYAERFQ